MLRPARRRRARGIAETAVAASMTRRAALFEHLRALRLDLARREKIAAYMVFPDRTLIEMARNRPATASALREIHGVGEAKLARYGRGVSRPSSLRS